MLDLDLAIKYNGSFSIDSSKNLHDFNSSLPAVQLDFSVSAGLSFAGFTQPSQQTNTAWPSSVTLIGVPIDPRRLWGRIGQYC